MTREKREPFRLLLHPLIFLVAYILLIPVFAAIYWSGFSKAFYAPNVHRETTTWDKELDWATPSVQSAMDRASKADDPQGRRNLTAAEYPRLEEPSQRQLLHAFVLDDLQVSELQTDGVNLRFRIYYGLKTDPDVRGDNGNATGYTYREHRLVAKFFKKGTPVTDSLSRMRGPPDSYMPTPGVLLIQRDEEPWPINDPVFKSISPYAYGGNLRVIYLDDSESDIIDTLLKEYDGGSPKIGGDFGRMSYFSVVVATTLGFGDIVPVTDGARIAVAAEAILGVMFAGMFLTAVAYRASARTNIDVAMQTAIDQAVKESLARFAPGIAETPREAPGSMATQSTSGASNISGQTT